MGADQPFRPGAVHRYSAARLERTPRYPRISRDQIGHSSRAVIDATRPYEWRDKFPKVSGASQELKDRVANNWRDCSKKN